MSPALRIIFAGTPEFAAIHLNALLDSHHQVVAVYTQPDRPSGRGKKLTPSAVKALATERNVQVLQPGSLKTSEAQAELAALNADVMVVVAYGLILPQAVLDAPRLGCINVHGSLLPRWRGAAPIQRAIESGDGETGITIMQMDEGLDTGAMLLKTHCPITDSDTTTSLFAKLADQGPAALLEALAQLATGSAVAKAQDHSAATYAHKIMKEEALIDWSQSAQQIQRRIRAFDPFPGCYGVLQGQRIKLWQSRIVATPSSQLGNQLSGQPGTIVKTSPDSVTIACGNGALEVSQVQLPNKPRASVADIHNGHPGLLVTGKVLGDQ